MPNLTPEQQSAIKTLQKLLPRKRSRRKVVQDARLSAWTLFLLSLAFAILWALWFWIAGWLCS